MNNIKPKRGKEFTIKETGETVYLERIKSAVTYFVCDSPNSPLQGNYFDIHVSTLSENKKVVTGLNSKPKLLTAKEKTEKQIMNEFFAMVALRMPYNCEECGKPLYAYNQFAKRCVSGHILPKAYFPSVATKPDNIIFLGASILGVCECHNHYDEKGSEYRSKMKIYKTVLERFEILKLFLSDKELVSAYSYLNLKFE